MKGTFRSIIFCSLVTLVFAMGEVKSTGFAYPKQDALIAVLCYHHVDLKMKTPYTVTSEQLTSHIKALKKAGFQFVTLKQIDDYVYNGASIPTKSVAITFDDGNHNTYKVAYPLLKKLGVPFALFVYPTAIGVGNSKGFMNWDEVKALSKAGVIIGCHSMDHPYLTRPGAGVKTSEDYDKWLTREIVTARTIIESHIGVSINYYALPFGLSDYRVYEATKTSGYRLVFNVNGMTNSQYSDPFFYNRMIVVDTESAEKVVQKSSTRPIYFSYTNPSMLTRITQPDFNAEYTLMHPDEYNLSTARLLLGKPAKGYEQESSTLNENVVHLTKEAYYSATVLAKDKQGRDSMGSWSFIYQKSLPSFISK